MSLVNTNVLFATDKPIDKVVGIFEGEFDGIAISGSDLIWDRQVVNGYTFDEFYYPIYHSFTRPVFCEMFFSLDNGITWLPSGSYDPIDIYSFSVDCNSEYIRIWSTAGAFSRVKYRVLCYWIDDYDDSNPSIDVVNQSNQLITFRTPNNYRRLYSNEVLTFTSTEPEQVIEQEVKHRLGYIPKVVVFTESRPGVVTQVFGEPYNEFDSRTVHATYSVNTSRVLVRWYGPVHNPVEPRRVWVRIYED